MREQYSFHMAGIINGLVEIITSAKEVTC